ncbi:MAG: sugar ABC transporter substrate-binding protein [Caldilineaceae bacterium]|nr:sugar ABC transporter substrate-binding protein [Caldilineaceae bacterium]
MKRLSAVLSLLLLVAFTAACAAPAAAPAAENEGTASTAADADARTICFAYQDLETEFWVAGHKAIVETLTGLGINVIERNANEDANKQLEQVKDCIAQSVDGIIIIPQDGESAVTIVGEANKADIPIGVFNRPPADDSNPALVIVADNEVIAQQAVEYMAEEAKTLGRKVTPLIMVGDLGDPNAVGRRQGFYNVIEANPDLFNEVIEVPTKWDGALALSNLEAAMQANPEVDFLFTSSDFMYPMIRSVLEPLNKWQVAGDENHVILGGLDGDSRACQLMRDGYVDATGVQDLFFEADTIMNAMLEAIDAGETQPNNWMDDPGFALTQANWEERAEDMWGCKLFAETGESLERSFGE